MNSETNYKLDLAVLQLRMAYQTDADLGRSWSGGWRYATEVADLTDEEWHTLASAGRIEMRVRSPHSFANDAMVRYGRAEVDQQRPVAQPVKHEDLYGDEYQDFKADEPAAQP